MISVESPFMLEKMANKLEREGAIGFLLSGGCDASGSLPIDPFLPSIAAINESTHLRINAHIGYPPREKIPSLVEAGIDAFSITFPISDRIGREYLRVENAIDRYLETVDALRRCGARRVIPHVLLGLSSLDEDMRGLELLAKDSPRALVAIAFTPLENTPLSTRPPTSEYHLANALKCARELMPNASIVLGCMRPRGHVTLETMLMKNILNGIVMPSRRAEKKVEESGLIMEHHHGCCAIYL